MTEIVITPQPGHYVNVVVHFDLEGVPDMKATPTITVRPHHMSISYHRTSDGWSSGLARVHGRRVLKSGEVSESSAHEVFTSSAEPWVKAAIKAYRPKNQLEIETETLKYWDAKD